jgi:cation transport regulator ChaB
MHKGVDGLLRDKTRPPGRKPLDAEIIERVICPHRRGLARRDNALDRRHDGQDGRYQHFFGAADLEAHGLQPHRVSRFKLSRDPEFVPKLRDIVGPYIDPPAHAIVLSVDEKSQIQALDRTQPGLPMKKGRAGTMTYDYKRHGTTTLFAALDVIDGKVIGRCMQRHRHQEFIRFLNAVEAETPVSKIVHVVLDNYATHKHPKVKAWLARHPRFVFHFTPKSCSRLNAVETLFSRLTRRRLKRGVFRSIVDLQAAINRFLAETNADPKPFVWTAHPDRVIAAVRRGMQALESLPAVRCLLRHAQAIFRSAFNAAWVSYAEREPQVQEETAFRVTWAAVKQRYREAGDTWVREIADTRIDSVMSPTRSALRPEQSLAWAAVAPPRRPGGSIAALAARGRGQCHRRPRTARSRARLCG